MNKEYWKEILNKKPKDEFTKYEKFVIQNCSQKEIVENTKNAILLLYGSVCNLLFNLNKEEYVNDFKNRLFDLYLWLEIIDYYYNHSDCAINNESYNRQLYTLKSFVKNIKNK